MTKLRLFAAFNAYSMALQELQQFGKILSDDDKSRNVDDAALSYGKCMKVNRQEINAVKRMTLSQIKIALAKKEKKP